MHLSTTTVMSAPSSIEAYDAQMLDFSSDTDVPMNITGSAEFFAEALMDHDDHLVPPSYGDHPSIEVDMEEYVGDNAEYEMADETSEYQRLHGDELLDVEVYDASHVASPLAPPLSLQPSVDVPIDSDHLAPASRAYSEHALPKTESELPPTPPDQPAADVPHVEPSALEEGILSEVVAPELSHLTDTSDEGVPHEAHVQLSDTVPTDGPSLETSTPAEVDEEAELHVLMATGEHPAGSVAQHENSEPPTAESVSHATAEAVYHDGPPIHSMRPETEKEAVDSLHVSDGVYIDSPPAVLVSITHLSDPGYALFNQPTVEGESTEEPHGAEKTYSLLLEDRPTLYYEPLSSVFEALRQDEALLSRVPHSFEGELVLEAYDLQLVVSEDNVHSREISLHDLNVLHDGSDFAGPLRLLLRAIVPRFIIRYYALQEQIQRLNVTTETGEDHGEEHQEHYDTSEEQPQLRQDQLAVHPIRPAVSSAGVKETEALDKEAPPSSELTEEIHRENYEPDDTPGVQEPVVDDQTTHALEDKDDYEGANPGDEDESVKTDEPNADQVHEDTPEDADTAATVTGHESEFEGEQTEYLDYVQHEEYDERYGEDLSERSGGALPVQYGESAHFEEGEPDTTTTVDEARAIPPGSDEQEDDKSTSTPTPVRTALEPESGELAGDSDSHELAPSNQDDLVPSNEDNDEAAISESTSEVVNAQLSGNEKANITPANAFSEVEESDSNFVSMLEREADAEFNRIFSTEQSGQDITAATLQHETWDEWDDEDAEGEDEEDWIDPDAASNESSVTLSSKASSKRSYDEVEPGPEAYVGDPQSSPGSKRPRVE